MSQRASYWSCTDFADWLRGIKKPSSATAREWKLWRQEAKKNKFRYWLAEEALDAIQSTLWWPVDKIYDIKYYINNRWVTRAHQLSAHRNDINPGDWCDLGNRFLPCLFNELVDFVEIELAWSHIAWSEKEERKRYGAPFWASGWFRWRTWRCPQAGLDHLEWAKNLTNEEWLEDDQKHLAEPTHQAIAAKEILELYNWWKNIYPNRPDPMDSSGWTQYCAEKRDPNDDILGVLDNESDTPEEQNRARDMLDEMNKLEKQYADEDTEMMYRLIKIREALWT